MFEILKSNPFLPVYGLTWILSIFKLPRYFDSILKYLPIIIGYTLFTEILGVMVFHYDDFTFFSAERYSYYNVLIYNLYDLIFFPFFLYVYYKSLSNNILKKIVKYGAIAFLLAIVINSFITSPLKYELWYAYIVGSTILIISTLSYLYSQRRKSPGSLNSKNLLFWVSLGLLIFHLGYLPITIFKNLHFDLVVNDYESVRKVHICLILVMYGCFVIGFLRMRRFKSA